MKTLTGIRPLREARGLTQAELAREVRVTRSYIAQMERGEKQNPSLPLLRALARALGVTLTDLLD